MAIYYIRGTQDRKLQASASFRVAPWKLHFAYPSAAKCSFGGPAKLPQGSSNLSPNQPPNPTPEPAPEPAPTSPRTSCQPAPRPLAESILDGSANQPT